MTIETIQSRTRFHALRDNWNTVYRADREAQYFLSWQWLSQLYERRDEEVRILAFRNATEDRNFAAFLPLRRQVHLSSHGNRFSTIYRLPGNYWADYTGMLCMPDHDRRAIPAFGRRLAGLPWERLLLENLNISDERLELLLQSFRGSDYSIRHHTRRDTDSGPDLRRAPRIDLPSSFDTYLQLRLSANTRQRIRRYRRKLQADSDMQMRKCSVETMNEDLRHFERLWIARWAIVKGAKVNKLASRYSLILRQALESGDMYMPVMLRAGRPIGMVASYIDRVKRTLLFFVGARDTAEKQLPIGLLLHAASIEWATQKNFQYYDFLRGDEPYKYSLGATDQIIKTLFITATANHVAIDNTDDTFVDRSLAKLRNYQKSASRADIEKLYQHLRDDWPNEASKILRHRAKWLN